MHRERHLQSCPGTEVAVPESAAHAEPPGAPGSEGGSAPWEGPVPAPWASRESVVSPPGRRPPGSSSDFGGNPWRLPSHESRMALPLTSSPALQARPPSLTENEGPGRTGRNPGNAGVGVQTSHGACGGPDARDLRRADVSAAPLSPKPPASRTARESSSLPTFSSDGLCFFQVSDGAQSFVKKLLSWKIPRTPSWAKSSVQRDTPPLEDEGSGSSPDGLRPAHLSPYRDAEQEVRGCRHAGARPGPTASPRDRCWPPLASRLELAALPALPPFPIAPALRQDLGCSRIVHRAGQTVMASCDRCGHPFIKQQLRVTLSERWLGRSENARCVSDPKAVHRRRVPGSGRFSNVLLQGLNGPATPRSRRCHWAWWPCLAVPSAVERRPRPRTSTFARPAPTRARAVWT